MRFSEMQAAYGAAFTKKGGVADEPTGAYEDDDLEGDENPDEDEIQAQNDGLLADFDAAVEKVNEYNTKIEETKASAQKGRDTAESLLTTVGYNPGASVDAFDWGATQAALVKAAEDALRAASLAHVIARNAMGRGLSLNSSAADNVVALLMSSQVEAVQVTAEYPNMVRMLARLTAATALFDGAYRIAAAGKIPLPKAPVLTPLPSGPATRGGGGRGGGAAPVVGAGALLYLLFS